MKTAKYRPRGDRILGAKHESTEKAVRFEYYGWLVWLPKRAVTKVHHGPYTAPAWAIDSAKEHPSARYLGDPVGPVFEALDD